MKHNQSGFLIEESEVDNLFPEFLLYCLSRSKEQLNYMAINANKLATLFTLEAYYESLKRKILGVS